MGHPIRVVLMEGTASTTPTSRSLATSLVRAVLTLRMSISIVLSSHILVGIGALDISIRSMT